MLSATGKNDDHFYHRTFVGVVRISLELPSLLKERQGVVLVLPLGAVLPGGRLPLRLDPGDTDDLHQVSRGAQTPDTQSNGGINITPTPDLCPATELVVQEGEAVPVLPDGTGEDQAAYQ